MISVIIPAKNEGKIIGETISTIIRYFKFNSYDLDDYEIIVVNDGSTDNTNQIIMDLQSQNPQVKDNIKIISNSINRGKGYSVRKGLLYSKGDIFLILDSDLSTPIAELSRLMIYLVGNDMVISSRYCKDSIIKKKQSMARKLYGRLYNSLVRNLLNLNYYDTQNGFKLYNARARRLILKYGRIDGFSFDAEQITICNENNLQVKEVPITWQDNKPQEAGKNQIISMFAELLLIKVNKNQGNYNENPSKQKEKKKN